MANDGVPRFELGTDYPAHAALLTRLEAEYKIAHSKALIKHRNEPNQDVREALALVDVEEAFRAYSEAKAIDTEHAVTMNCLHIEMTAKYHDFNSKSWREREG